MSTFTTIPDADNVNSKGPVKQGKIPNGDDIARVLTKELEGKLEQSKIDSLATSLTLSTPSYPANASVASLIFWLKFDVDIKPPNKKTFNGTAGGINSAGAGTFFGDVYSDDLNGLYSRTCHFTYVSSPVYLGIIFMDESYSYLGTFQGGGVSTVGGAGGGTGSWSY